MKARLARGILANGYGQVVTIVGQVVSVPLLIQAWGATGYGTWVLLTAIPTALAFVDGGLVVASGNAMTMAVARGAEARAAALYTTVRRSLIRALLAAALLSTLAIVAAPSALLAAVAPLAPGIMRDVLVLLTGVVLSGTLSTLPAAALRAGGLYASAVSASTTIRLAEFAAILLAAAAGCGVTGSAAAWLAVRVAGAGCLFGMARRRLPWLGTDGEPAPALRPLVVPALASVAMPAGFAAGLQGVTLAIGLALSPGAVALFAATRTLARAAVQLSGLVNHALMPEMARMAGRQDRRAMQHLARWNTLSCAALLGLGWLGTILAGPAILSAWTGGRLHPDPGLLALLASTAAVHGLWLGQANLLLAVNRQAEFGWLFLMSSLAVVVLAWPVASSLGLSGVGALTLAGEVVMALRLAWSRPHSTAAIEGTA